MTRPIELLTAVAVAALVLGGCGTESEQSVPDRGSTSDTAPNDASGERSDADGPSADGTDAADATGTDATLCGGVSCDDKLACTEDLCVATGCLNKVKTGHCLISKTCYKDGAKQGGSGSCHTCDSSTSSSAWTEDVSLCTTSGPSCTTTKCSAGACKAELNTGHCLISNVCIKHGEANPKNSCRVCNTSMSTTSYQNLSDGVACTSDGLGCTDDVCKTGACDHPLKTGYCKIAGVCYYDGELSALLDCNVCQPAKSSTSWSTVADGTKCTDDGISCTTDTCKAGACVNALAAGYCTINNSCYKSGHTNPSSECQGCVPSKSTKAWSDKPGGTKCTADSLSCTTDTCQAGACTHKLSSSACLIGGKCYATGATAPGLSCKGCNPSISASAWSQLPGGSSCAADSYVCTDDVCQGGSCTHPLKSGYCRIAGTCYKAGTKNPAQSCQHCDPKSSVTSWSGAADGTSCKADAYSCTDDVCKAASCTHTVVTGSCLINNQCFSAGQVNPGNPCQECVPAISTTGWNILSNGAQCPGGRCLNGGCCKGCVSGSICHPGLAPGACGKDGNNCTSCPTGWSCSAGACKQQSCPPGGKTFSYTGGVQVFQVPSNCTTLTVTARGAGGGTSTSVIGGTGGLMEGKVPVNPGATYHVVVGGKGNQPTYNRCASGGGGFSGLLQQYGSHIISAGGGGGGAGSTGGGVGGPGGGGQGGKGQCGGGGAGGPSTSTPGGGVGGSGALAAQAGSAAGGGRGGNGASNSASGGGGGGYGTKAGAGGTQYSVAGNGGAGGFGGGGGGGGGGWGSTYARISAGGGGGGGHRGGWGGHCPQTCATPGGGGGGGGGSNHATGSVSLFKNVTGGGSSANQHGSVTISWP